MPKVICTLPNASELISGVKFISHKDGMISEEVSEEVAATFTEIPGYVVAGAVPEEDAQAGHAGADDAHDAEAHKHAKAAARKKAKEEAAAAAQAGHAGE